MRSMKRGGLFSSARHRGCSQMQASESLPTRREKMRRSLPWILPCIVAGMAALLPAAGPPTKRDEIPDFVKGAEGLEDALRNLKAKMASTPPLSPAESLKHFTVRNGLVVDLIAHEPTVRQPLYI